MTFFVGPEAQAAIFSAQDSQLDQRPVYKFTIPVFGPGIAYDATPKDMARQLRFLKHGLDRQAMLNHSTKIIDEVEDFFKDWPEDGVVDLHAVFSDLVIKTASRALIGKEVRQNLQSEVADLYQDLSDGMTHLTFAFPNLPTPNHKRRDRARARMVEIFKQVLKKRREDQAKGAPVDDDLLQLLMDSKYPDGRPITDDEVCGLMLATLFGGQHTSSITSTWMGLQLHGCPDSKNLLRRLRQEQRDVLQNEDAPLTYEALQKMELMYSCVKETLRYYPPLIMLMRQVVNQPFQYKDWKVPEGHIVMVSPSVGHRLEHVYHDADTFIGDRFLEEKWQDAAAVKASFISFGGGRHMCLGRNFGLLQVATIWSYLLRHFEFELVEPIPDVDYSHLVAGPTVAKIRFRRKKLDFSLDESLPAEIPLKNAEAEEKSSSSSSSSAAPGDGGLPEFTLEEIGKHNTPEDLWIRIGNKVYDVTKFQYEHPGGDGEFRPYAGGERDAEQAFEINHPSYVREDLPPLQVGTVKKETKQFTMEEIAKHNTEDDCWLVIDGKVYDVTNFLPDHPGGSERVVPISGGDVSFEFEQQNHSAAARAMMQEFEIGVVAK